VEENILARRPSMDKETGERDSKLSKRILGLKISTETEYRSLSLGIFNLDTILDFQRHVKLDGIHVGAEKK